MRVYLDEATHTYRNEKGDLYTSTSNLIAFFKDKFDAQTAAVRYAEKHGQTPEYWLQQWANKRDKACDVGHRFHADKEEEVSTQAMAIRFGRHYKVRNQFLMADDISRYADGVYTEMTLWHHGYRLAGQADKVFIGTIDNIRYADIDDYKTNERIELVSYQSKSSGRHKMMKNPLGHLMDCNYFHYELQQSVYAFMLEANGFVPRTLRLFHHGHTQDGGRKKEGEPYVLNYRKREVLAMAETYRKFNKAA